MGYTVEAIPNSMVDLGEGPFWDVQSQNLYYVDIPNAMILRYSTSENKVYRCKIENETYVGFIIPVEGKPKNFVVGVGRNIAVVEWDGVATTCKVIKVLDKVEQNDERYEGNRWNDGKCDPKGRLFAGTMRCEGDDLFEFRLGKFYKYNKGKMVPIIDNIGISNGLTWNETTKKMYYIDSADFNVKEFDYDMSKGDIKNQKILYDATPAKGAERSLPDGMTIDSDGYLYVAVFNGSSILKIDPKTGKTEMKIQLPVKQITSVAFGGMNLDILFVTTANINQEAPAGTTYKIRGLGVTGLPMTKCCL